jgi:hypothetical protein
MAASVRGARLHDLALPPCHSAHCHLGQSWLIGTACIAVLLGALACVRGTTQLRGWEATQPGMELSIEEHAGPHGEAVLALLYTVVTGKDYAIERRLPIDGLQGPPDLRLTARATRVLHLAAVLVDAPGTEHECALTLVPGEWRELRFDCFQPPVDDWTQISLLRLVDHTGELGGQGPVSLKLVGLPL